MIVFIAFAAEAPIRVIFWALFSAAHDADKQQEPAYDEDRRHSGLLEED